MERKPFLPSMKELVSQVKESDPQERLPQSSCHPCAKRQGPSRQAVVFNKDSQWAQPGSLEHPGVNLQGRGRRSDNEYGVVYLFQLWSPGWLCASHTQGTDFSLLCDFAQLLLDSSYTVVLNWSRFCSPGTFDNHVCRHSWLSQPQMKGWGVSGI